MTTHVKPPSSQSIFQEVRLFPETGHTQTYCWSWLDNTEEGQEWATIHPDQKRKPSKYSAKSDSSPRPTPTQNRQNLLLRIRLGRTGCGALQSHNRADGEVLLAWVNLPHSFRGEAALLITSEISIPLPMTKNHPKNNRRVKTRILVTFVPLAT